jgi:hypothetical protein
MCCTGYFVQMMIGLIKNNINKTETDAFELMEFLSRNTERSHPKREAKKGRTVMGLKPAGSA